MARCQNTCPSSYCILDDLENVCIFLVVHLLQDVNVSITKPLMSVILLLDTTYLEFFQSL